MTKLASQQETAHPMDAATSNELTASMVHMIRRALPATKRQLSLKGSDTLDELGLSSLRLVGLILQLEEEFGIPEEALLSFRRDMTLDGLVALCESSMAHSKSGVHLSQPNQASAQLTNFDLAANYANESPWSPAMAGLPSPITE